jgi:3-O-methylgallate 3,4-dioxygenase
MAEIVLGIGSSHSPLLLMEPAGWLARGRQDVTNPLLRDFDGTKITYEEVLARTDQNWIARELRLDVMEARHVANQKAIAQLSKTLDAANPDLVIVLGDDHKEVFLDDNMPALSIYWGDNLPYKPQKALAWRWEPELKTDLWYWEDEREYPVASAYALRLIDNLINNEFDVAHSQYLRPSQGMSHSFGYYYRRVMADRVYPIIPISVNTYWPPNQVPPGRAYHFGQAVRRAVESWPDDVRVAVVATGGLSHFLVDEELDKMFLDVLASKNGERYAQLPINKLQSGNSELRCWSALAGAVDHLDMQLLDYVPCYRSIAGTGCGMAFASWS